MFRGRSNISYIQALTESFYLLDVFSNVAEILPLILKVFSFTNCFFEYCCNIYLTINRFNLMIYLFI